MEFTKNAIRQHIKDLRFNPIDNLVELARTARYDKDRIECNKILFVNLMDEEKSSEAKVPYQINMSKVTREPRK